MMYEVSLKGGVNFAPSTEVAEILQNVRTILATRKGSVPLERDFGVSWEHIDKPLPLARTLMIGEIIDAIEEHEPRVTVKKVEFNNNITDIMDGLQTCRVFVAIGDEENEEDW